MVFGVLLAVFVMFRKLKLHAIFSLVFAND